MTAFFVSLIDSAVLVQVQNAVVDKEADGIQYLGFVNIPTLCHHLAHLQWRLTNQTQQFVFNHLIINGILTLSQTNITTSTRL